MKKVLLLMTLGAFAAMPVMAQEEEDMTQYIANAGFDEDLTFQADGKMKEAISTSTVIGRSLAYISEDSTVYARPQESTSQSRPDGRKMEAVNGFIGRIKGWTVVTNQVFPKCEWVYFGSVPYALGEEAVPIADDGSTYLGVPEKPEEIDTEDNVGAVYLRAGWGGSCVYKQVVSLPCAEYRLDYWVRNFNYEGSKNNTKVKNLCKVTCRRDEFVDEDGFAAEQWTKHSISFTPVSDFTIEFGFQSDGGSGSNPYLFIDGIKLYKIGEADPADLLREDLYYYNDQVLSLEDSLVGVNGDFFYGLWDETEQLQEEYLYEDDDLEQLKESIAKLKQLFNDMNAAAQTAKRVEALYIKAENLTDATDYPGKDALKSYLETIYKLLYEDGTAAQVTEAETALQNAIKDYYFSQPASMEAPANYSFLVQHPWFCIDGREPASNAIADVADAALADGDKNADGWVNGSTASATTGAWFKVGRTCYQLWATNFSGYLDAHQELTGLPNGVYSVSADFITNTDALSDQHIYATSSLGQTEGYMTEAGVCYEWPSGDYTGAYPIDDSVEDPWETVTSAGTVIVTDGKLTIGARSTHGDPEVEDISADARRGCFWFTNVVLQYHGEASEEQIAAAVAARVEKANELVAAMHFAADKAQVNDSLAAYNESKDIVVLNNGIALAETSEGKYTEIMSEGKTLPTVEANLADDAIAQETYGNYVDLVKYANDATLAWIQKDEASYTLVDSVLNVMKGYVNTYVQAANAAVDAASGFRSTAKEVVNAVLDSQKATLLKANPLLTVEEVNELVSALNAVLRTAQAQDSYERDPNATDYTGWILNPNFAADEGWTYTVTAGDGPVKSGQYYNGDAAYKYFDSYNSTRGELVVTGEQVIEGLPNGTYQAKALTRTPGTGAFIFAAVGETKADSIFKEIPLQYYTYFDEELQKDTTVLASDRYGALWEAAYNEVINNGNTDPEVLAIFEANGSQGRGWNYTTIDNIVVKNHVLTIGQTTDPARTGVVFDGNWFSVTDWELTLIEKGNNDGWNGPLTGVKSVPATLPAQTDGIYTLDGRRANHVARGLYIVVSGGKASKVLVK